MLYILIVLLMAFLVSKLGRDLPKAEEITITQFVEDLKGSKVEELTKEGPKYQGKYKDGKEFEVFISNQSFYEFYLKDLVDSKDLKFVEEPIPPTPWYIQILPTVVLLIAMIGIWYVFMTKTQGGGGMSGFAKSKAKLHNQGGMTKVSFKDVAGLEEEKEELEEIVDFLKNPKKYTAVGARIPKGVLMVGQPGTGKTYLSRAVAGEAKVPFFSISGSDFVEMFVGVGASRVRDLFDQAKKNAPCIVFIDEIDAVGRRRGAGQTGGHDEREQTLNQLLVEMDGFQTNEGIIVMAATNRVDILDPALTRPGRFDRTVTIGLPDVKAREEILLVHTRNKKLDTDVNLKAIAKTTAGFTPADLENLCNEAALLTARENKSVIPRRIFEEAAIKVVAGPEKRSKVVVERERIITAYHEVGHAVVSRLMPYTDKVHMITIIPRGSAGGFTAYIPDEENSYYAKDRLVDRLSILLGGRAAEEVALTDISSGASNDIERATQLARYMITKFGMSKTLGPINYDAEDENPYESFVKPYSDKVAYSLDSEVKDLIEEAHAKAIKIIRDNLALVHMLSEELLEKETINGDEFEELFQKYHVGEDPKSYESGEIIDYDLLLEKGIIDRRPSQSLEEAEENEEIDSETLVDNETQETNDQANKEDQEESDNE